jgi:surfactin synthase thioesterase subunit
MCDVLLEAAADEISGAFLMGHSLGGYLAYEVAARRASAGHLVPGLIISGTSPPHRRPVARASAFSDTDLVRWLTQLGAADTESLSEVLPYTGEMLRADLRAFESYMPSLSPLHVPSLLLSGSEDILCTPSDLRDWSAWLTDWRAFTVVGNHHFIETAPRATAALLVAFVSPPQP